MSRTHPRLTYYLTFILVALAGLAAGVYYYARGSAAAVDVTTLAITRGSVVKTITATGTLEAMTTVQVGSQVSGIVESLHADFNSIVRKGQVLARLDPTLLKSQVESAKANLTKAESDVERLRVALENADAGLARARQLASRALIAAVDLDAADMTRRSAAAQVKSAEAQVLQARAALSQAELNLEKTVITSPIDGIVVSREVEVGQTVSASMQAPTLFLIAEDMGHMRVNATVDESDVATVAAGQSVGFRVDAFPETEFKGTVSQVRLQPVVEQNVVTYDVLIDVPNPALKLRPGMTTTVTIEVARRDNVLRIANAALRFRPTEEALAALAPAVPGSDARADAEATPVPAVAEEAVPVGTGLRLASPSDASLRPASLALTGAAPDAALPAPAALFDPADGPETSGQVWVMVGGRLTQVAVRLGVNDGTNTELRSTGLPEGTEVVTRVQVGAVTTTASPASSPLLGSGPGMGRRF